MGGDTDTIGAVAGQIACPLLSADSVVDALKAYTALNEVKNGPLRAAGASSRRLFRRAMLFAAEDYEALRGSLSLLDADYSGIWENGQALE